MIGWKSVWQNTRGNAYPLAVAITLSLLLVFCGLWEYFRLNSIAQTVRDELQSAMIGTVNDNYDDVYHGVREGYAGAYQPNLGESAQDFISSMDKGDVYGRLDRQLGLHREGTSHIKRTADGQTEYRLSGLQVTVQNLPLAPGGTPNRQLQVEGLIHLEVPISFAGSVLPPMTMRIQTVAGYTAIF